METLAVHLENFIPDLIVGDILTPLTTHCHAVPRCQKRTWILLRGGTTLAPLDILTLGHREPTVHDEHLLKRHMLDLELLD